jgi:hypothetical protein
MKPELAEPGFRTERFEGALRRFDEENARDPNRESANGAEHPRELLYAQRLTDWVLRLKSDASELLRLAARSAHLCRWVIPRHAYPMDRAGYLRWRQDLKRFHAAKVAEILKEAGYDDLSISKVQGLVSKAAFPSDPDSRVLEDALCLVFLQWQFGNLAAKTSDEKMINAVQKSWKKMTSHAREFALKLDYSPREKDLLARALAGDE